MTTSPPEPTPVYWGTVGHGDDRPPPPPRRPRPRVPLVLGTVVGVFGVAAVGGLLLAPGDDDGPRAVAEDYVAALKQLDCDAVADLSLDSTAARFDCRRLSRRAIYRDARYDVGREVRESVFTVTGVDERPRQADVDVDIAFSGEHTPAVIRLVRDDEARWRVDEVRADSSRR